MNGGIQVEIKDLQYFVQVVKHGSFTKAAAHIYLSQPTLSKAIKKLEEQLHVQLLDRSTRTLKLTDAGAIVYKQALKILREAEELRQLLDDINNLPSGEIKFGVPPIVGTLFFPSIAKGFRERYPHISLELIEVGAKKIEKLVEEDQVDVGIIAFPTDTSKFNVSTFVREEFLIYTSANQYAEVEEPVSLNCFAEEHFILLTKEFTTREIILSACQTAGFVPNIAYESSQWDLIMELVSDKQGITLMPKSVYNKVNKKKIKALSLQSSPLWELGIITRKDRYQSFAVKALLQFLKAYRAPNA